MKTLTAASFLVLLIVIGEDQTAFQGIWDVVEYDQNGQKPSAAILKKMQVTIKGDKLIIYPHLVAEYKPVFKDGKTDKEVVFATDSSKSDEIRFRLNPEKRWIELGEAKLSKGIYLLDGESLKICFATEGKNRPKKFPEQPKTGTVRMVLKKAGK